MAVNWNLQAVEILEKLGCAGSGGQEFLEKFQRENGGKLPRQLFGFLRAAWNCPLFCTADIWTRDGKAAPSLHFFYEEIDEMIECDREYWEESPEECANNDYYQMSQIPREDWGTRVPDYLLIGSDYGAGVVTFGIRADSLDSDDPPVYMQHEADPITLWTLYSGSVSDFVMQVLCDVLSCSEYHTAQEVLTEAGWTFQEFRTSRRGLRECGTPEEGRTLLQERGIDLSGAKKYRSTYGSDAYIRCGWEEETRTLYIAKEDLGNPERGTLTVFSKP